jgi:hypothetical protein
MRALGPRPGERSTMSFLASYVGIEIEFLFFLLLYFLELKQKSSFYIRGLQKE